MSHPLSEYSDEEIYRLRHKCNKCGKWVGEKQPGHSGYCYNCEKEMEENPKLKCENERLKLELENIKLKKEIAILRNMVIK
jgi:hypothetical protein